MKWNRAFAEHLQIRGLYPETFVSDPHGNFISFNTSTLDEHRKAAFKHEYTYFLDNEHARLGGVLLELSAIGCGVGVFWYTYKIARELYKYAVSNNETSLENKSGNNLTQQHELAHQVK